LPREDDQEFDSGQLDELAAENEQARARSNLKNRLIIVALCG